MCGAEADILNGDADNAGRMKLYNAGDDLWKQLKDAGAVPNQVKLLTAIGAPASASVDVTTVIWWTSAMESYAQALAAGTSLVDVGEAIVKDGTLGYNEPWLILAAWNMLGNPALQIEFTCPLIKRAAVASASA